MNRVAILGAGIGAQHLEGYRASVEHWQPALLVDQNIDRARAIAGDIPTANSIADALDDPSIDVIDICLPPHLHVPVALKALDRGKHVICEKPLATSLTDIDKLRTAELVSGRMVFPVFQYRFGPAFETLDALRAADLLGKPIAACAETHWARGAEYYATGWRGTWAGEQGGAILTHAIHAHDLIAHHAGGITAVSACLTTAVNPIETEDTAALIFALSDGGLATSSVTLGAAQDETRLRFVYEHLTATSGTAPYTPGTGTWTFQARNPTRQRDIDELRHTLHHGPSGFAGALKAIAQALAGAKSKAVRLEDGARSVELATAIYASARTGNRISLPLPPDDPDRKGWQPT